MKIFHQFPRAISLCNKWKTPPAGLSTTFELTLLETRAVTLLSALKRHLKTTSLNIMSSFHYGT